MRGRESSVYYWVILTPLPSEGMSERGGLSVIDLPGFTRAICQRGGLPSDPPMNENFTFGITLTVIGMTGTLLSLWLLSFLISLLKKLFPYHPEKSHPKPSS